MTTHESITQQNWVSKRAEELLRFKQRRSVPLILQSEVAECGLACVGMIASYHGHKVNLNSLRTLFEVSSQGMNLREISNLSNQLGLTSRGLKCSLSDVTSLSLPCIVHWNLDHFVVITNITKRYVDVNDPAVGKRRHTWESFSNHFTGIALELFPSSEFTKGESKVTMKLSDLWTTIVGLKRNLALLLAVTLIIQVLLLTTPYYTQWIVDRVLLTDDHYLLVVLATVFSFLVIMQNAIKAFRSWILVRVTSSLTIQMGANLFRHLLQLPLTFFNKRHIGDIASRFNSIHEIREMLTTSVIEVVMDGLLAFAILGLMYLYHAKLATLILIIVFIVFLIQLAYFYPIRRIQEELINDEAREESIFLETLRSVQTLKLYGQEHHRTNLRMNRSADVVNSGIRLSKLNIAENTLVQILVGLESILLLYFGALAVMNEELTIGMLLAFIAYKTIFTQSVYNLIEKGFEFKLLGLHLERLSDITLHRRVKDRPNSLPAGNHLKGRLRFEKVGYRFPSNDQWVFRNLSFDITPGESVAIVGPSGSGKTTLLKTFLRLLEPSEGIISADGIDVSKIRLKDFRNRVSTVMQDDCLFSGTITDNITLFQSDVCPEKLAYFCEMAGIREDIEAMPMKYSSLVGDMGSTLSGGQVQRILLARALFSEPDILVLDESTSHLDTKTESILNDNIRDMNITRIIVAHRKDTIDSADRVINIHPDQLM